MRMKENLDDKMYLSALALLRKNGVKFTVEDLCKDVKMSKKTFYRLFPSKGDFACLVYKKAFAAFDSANEACSGKELLSSKESLALFSSFCNILAITDEKTFNLYSMSQTVEKSALSNLAQRKEAFKAKLALTSLRSVIERPSFFLSLQSTLSAIGKRADYDLLLKDYLDLLEKL